MWIRFKSTRPFAVKIHVGAINAISGEPLVATFATALRRNQRLEQGETIQDYVIVDTAGKGQLWLDGIAKTNGQVMQFVAIKSGSGYSVEHQVTGADNVGGIQAFVTPIKMGRSITLIISPLGRRHFKVQTHQNATIHELMDMISEVSDRS